MGQYFGEFSSVAVVNLLLEIFDRYVMESHKILGLQKPAFLALELFAESTSTASCNDKPN